MQIIVLGILGVYLFLVAASAITGHFGPGFISGRNMLLTLIAVAVTIAFVYIFIFQGQMKGLYGVAGGLFAISSIALNNGLNMRQRPNMKHHAIRMLINGIFLVLLYLVK